MKNKGITIYGHNKCYVYVKNRGYDRVSRYTRREPTKDDNDGRKVEREREIETSRGQKMDYDITRGTSKTLKTLHSYYAFTYSMHDIHINMAFL